MEVGGGNGLTGQTRMCVDGGMGRQDKPCVCEWMDEWQQQQKGTGMLLAGRIWQLGDLDSFLSS
jgi:hypothetical protein